MFAYSSEQLETENVSLRSQLGQQKKQQSYCLEKPRDDKEEENMNRNVHERMTNYFDFNEHAVQL